eukprot:8347160-Alexandrium_andersonii.AAC.1
MAKAAQALADVEGFAARLDGAPAFNLQGRATALLRLAEPPRAWLTPWPSSTGPPAPAGPRRGTRGRL